MHKFHFNADIIVSKVKEEEEVDEEEEGAEGAEGEKKSVYVYFRM